MNCLDTSAMLRTEDKVDLGPFLQYFVMRNPFETTQAPENEKEMKLENIKSPTEERMLLHEKWSDEGIMPLDTSLQTNGQPTFGQHIGIKVEKEDKSYEINLNKKQTCNKSRWKRRRGTQVASLVGKVLLARARCCSLRGELRRKHETLRKLKNNYRHVKQQLLKLHHTLQQISQQVMLDMHQMNKM